MTELSTHNALTSFLTLQLVIALRYKLDIRATPIPDLPILQVPSTAVRCIHKYRYQYRYMEIL